MQEMNDLFENSLQIEKSDRRVKIWNRERKVGDIGLVKLNGGRTTELELEIDPLILFHHSPVRHNAVVDVMPCVEMDDSEEDERYGMKERK